MADAGYEQRIAAQIEQYAQTTDMHDLPQVFHFWSNNYLRPCVEQVFEAVSIHDVFANAFCDCHRPGESNAILSIGSGDGSIEIAVARALLDRGVSDFKFVCAELSPILLANMRQKVSEAHLASHFEAVEADLNRIVISGPFAMIMANHSLHHIVELEHLFSYCRSQLRDGGIFAVNDMIGRNGHQRWPETAHFVNAIWPLLKAKQRYNVQLRRYNPNFVDHDCSGVGFEGIRAQDILPLMLDHFQPCRFVATGGFADLFFDRGYGPGFDVNDPSDVALARLIGELNENALDAALVKPTIMIAWFTKERRTEKYYRNRSARNCVRSGDPDWLMNVGQGSTGAAIQPSGVGTRIRRIFSRLN
jgi:SAM-dependent methyltransferase